MWEAETHELVTAIHGQPLRLVLAVTGGGSGAISLLLSVPGGSRTLLEASVPYSLAALTDWLGAPPEYACSSRTARAMAMVAFARARRFSPDNPAAAATLAGLGCTASLVSDRPKRGAHRIHVAWQTRNETVSVCLELHKDARSRLEEEQIASRLVLNTLASRCGLERQIDLPLREGEIVETVTTEAPAAWRALLLGEIDATSRRADEEEAAEAPKGKRRRAGNSVVAEDRGDVRALLSGAFDPWHGGHQGMARWASEHLGAPVDFELSILNVDKPPLDYQELRQRLQPFPATARVWLTRAATFVEKARLFPGATFVVGVDTLARIADPRYYAGDVARRDAAVEQIAAHGCRMLVFGRKQKSRGFVGGDQLELPAALRAIVESVREDQFREDISSTELRKARGDEGQDD